MDHSPFANGRLYTIEQMKRFQGYNNEFMAHMLNIFISHAGRTMDEFEAGMKDRDAAILKAAAHRIRPSIEFLEIAPLTGNIVLMEKWVGGFNDSLETLTQSIIGVLKTVVEQVKADLANNFWV